MSTTTTPILYNTSSGFTLSDNTKIQIIANSASLINNSGYPITNPTVLETFQMQASSLSAFVENAKYSGSDNVQYTILVSGVDYYWNGSAWVSSDGTYSKSNTASVINTNCGHSSMGTLLGTGSYVTIRAFLHSASGTTSPSLTGVSLTYTFAAIRPSNPAQCTIWVYLEDILGNVVGSVQNAILSVQQKDAFIYGQFVVAPFTKQVVFDSTGYAQLILDETQTPGYSVLFTISYNIGTTNNSINFIPCIVPNSGSCPLTSITTFAAKSATVAQITGNNSFNSIESQINISNNVSNIPIPQINFSPTSYSSVEVRINIRRQTSGNFFRFVGRMFLLWSQSSSTWSIAVVGDDGSSGPTSGVSFSVSTGAAPYYLPTITYSADDATLGSFTSYVGTMRYKVTSTFLLEQ